MEFRDIPKKNSALLMSFLSIFVAFVIAGIGAVILTRFIGVKSAGLLALVVGEALIIVPALIFINSRSYSLTKTLRLNPVPFSVILTSILIAASLQPIADEIDRLISSVIPYPEFLEKLLAQAEETLTVDSFGVFLAISFGAVIFAAISEEALFRGFLQKSLEADIKPIGAVLVSSLVFAIVHFSPQLIQIFLIGILLGYIALRTDSIVPTVIIHLLNNALAILFLNLGESQPDPYLWGNHVSPLFLIPSIVIFIFAVRQFHIQSKTIVSERADEIATENTT